MKRLFGLLVASLAIVVGVLGVFGMPSVFAGSGAAVASAAAPAQQIGMKVLVITDSANLNAATPYGDWVNTLQREGVPYDTMTANSASPGSVPLPALSSTAANGTQVANYEGVVVMLSGTMGLSDGQWATLQTFEHQFSVRQVTAYAVPSSDYGLSAPNPPNGGPLALGSSLTLTVDGKNVFPYLNEVSVDPTQSTYAYEGTPLAGQNVDTLLSGPGGSTLLGIYTSADGRQTMFQTFNENQYYLQSQLLRHGELDWLARNTYFGDQRNYLETDIDDNFLSDDTWDTTTHSTDFNPADALREVPADVMTAATWSAAHNFRLDMLFNGGGSVQAANGSTDSLLAQFQATCSTGCGPNNAGAGKPYTGSFGWINHTWDHPNIDEGCAPAPYIETEIGENSTWATTAAAGGNPVTGGLGLSDAATAADALGVVDPTAVVTGEHSGLANLIPGNPGQVDPPEFNTATPGSATGDTLATGSYAYAITDQFNTAAPGAAPVAGTGESAASVVSPVAVTGPTGDVALDWDAVCHAADYKIYRAPVVSGVIGAYSLITTIPADTTTDFTNTGPLDLSYTDTGTAGTAPTPPTVSTADEGPYEQNPVLDTAFPAAGIKYFGSDASKPYPSSPDASFATLAPGATYGGAESPVAASFTDAGATAIPRYPTNIYYNVSTDAQEVDEYTTLYDLPPGGECVNTSITTCYPSGTTFTIAQIIASVDQGVFGHMMGNDPRPTYFHQTNIMDQSTGSVTGEGTGLYYETMNPLLAEYSGYFASNAPIEQLTMAQIGTLLNEQATWLQNQSQVSGNIEGNVVTLDNTGAPINLPLTGTNIGTPYAGTQSGWTLAPTGTSTYKALVAWPGEPTGPVIVMVPGGPAPGSATVPIVTVKRAPTTAPTKYVVMQVAPKTVRMKHGKVTVSLKCEATKGKTPKGKVCAGKFTMKVKGVKHTLTHKFRIKTGKVYRIPIKVPNVAQAASTSTHKHPVYKASLVISTNQSHAEPLIKRGTLKIKT